ncbi:MAG: NAD nucleotidase [Pseudomonadota bacterium]|nr:NAD nucleotidase [Pseudomonadota bacterium]
MRHLKVITYLLCTLILIGSAEANQLTILHINDHHSHLRADGRMSLKINGEKTRVKSGGFPAVVSTFNNLSKGKKNVLKLHAGDAITGDLYYTLFKGEADAALMNQVCFDAFAIGNHEFDDGDTGLAKFLDFLGRGDCKTPALAANISPEVGSSALAKNSANEYLQPYTIIEKGDMEIGIIGIDIVSKTTRSSSPDETTKFFNEKETAQKYINELKSKGVKHIVLLTHYQYENDINLAKDLKGVDIIVGGDSHSLLGDFAEVGLNSKGPYPTIVENGDGNMVCIVQAWQYSQIVGELNVKFDNEGNVEACDGTPHLMLANSFKRKNSEGKRVEIEGDARKAAINFVENNKYLSIVEADPNAQKLLNTFSEKVDELKAQKVGEVLSDLCFERIPGQGRSKLCDVSQTAKNGSDISNLVAHAFREMTKTSEIAIQNGGGVRIDVPKGDFSIGTAYKLLPFANTIVELEMTGSEISQVLEEALDLALQPDGSTGAYPYAAGLRWQIDAKESFGSRFSNIQFKGPNDSSWVDLDLNRTYRVATNNYLAAGKDGYKTFGIVSKSGRIVNTYLDYAQSFVDYVKKYETIDKLPLEDYSTQAFKK